MFELVTQQLNSPQQHGRNWLQIRLKRERGTAEETDEAVVVIKKESTKMNTDFNTQNVFQIHKHISAWLLTVNLLAHLELSSQTQAARDLDDIIVVRVDRLIRFNRCKS